MKTVDFYFDFVSPYSWLASRQLPAIATRTGTTFRYLPILFAGMLNAHSNIGPAEIPAKRRYTFQDALRWAAHEGWPMEFPPTHPFNPLLALRLCSALEKDNDREALATALLQTAWGRGLDISDENVCRQVIRQLDMDPGPLLEVSRHAEVKELLRKNTEIAIAKGVFGIPSFIVDNELFWGNDRLVFLEEHLEGKLKIDKEHLEEILKRPTSSTRSVKA